ncbi:MAG: hypothetical protein WBL67_21710 [Nitrososphaeraceae archaeon]
MKEYNLKYLGLIGNVFHIKDIDGAIEKSRNFSHIVVNSYTQKSVGLDSGFSSSNFGVCITELRDGLVNVIHAEEYQRPDFNAMIQTTVKLLDQYDNSCNKSCLSFQYHLLSTIGYVSTLYQNGHMSINPKFTKLITRLRTAVENGERVLDK